MVFFTATWSTLELSQNGMSKKGRNRLCRTLYPLEVCLAARKRISRKGGLYKCELVYQIKMAWVRFSRTGSTMSSLHAFFILLSVAHWSFSCGIIMPTAPATPLLCLRQVKGVAEMEKGLWVIQPTLPCFSQKATCFPGTSTQGRHLRRCVFAWSWVGQSATQLHATH